MHQLFNTIDPLEADLKQVELFGLVFNKHTCLIEIEDLDVRRYVTKKIVVFSKIFMWFGVKYTNTEQIYR